MKLLNNTRISIVYIIASLLLFLFSYTQVDLSLTLSQASLYQTVQKAFQHIGFYERPLAAMWYVTLLVVLFSLYAWTLRVIRNGQLSVSGLWKIVGVITVILVFSYPAFSYDIFNHMFYAKEILVYHNNPYEVIPLQFTGVEPWLSFMHWTHVPSVFSPLWTLITLPFYLLGFGYFLPTLWSFKVVTAIGYVGCAWYIAKILAKKDPKNQSFGVAIFALNPLVIIESLVGAHNDIVMMAFAMMSVYFLVMKQSYKAFFTMAVSAATKVMTVFAIPVVLLGYRPALFIVSMSLALLAVLTKREIMPWYFLWIIPFVALLPRNRTLILLSSALSLGLLLRYAPFFYFGDWNPPVAFIKFWVTLIPPFLAAIFLLVKRKVSL